MIMLMTITMISQVQNRPTNVFTESLYAGYDKMIKYLIKGNLRILRLFLKLREYERFENLSKMLKYVI